MYGKLALGFYDMATAAPVGSNVQEGRRAASPPTADRSPITHFLIDRTAIRNADNSIGLNRNSVSNRPKKGIFRALVTYNLTPATCLPNRNAQE